MTTVRTYTAWQDLETTRDEWNALAARSHSREVFLTYDFLKSWSATSQRRMTPLLVVARQGSTLLGIAPMMIATRYVAGVPLKTIEFLGTPENDYSDFLYADPQVLDPLWKELRTFVAHVDAYYLQQIKASSPTSSFLEHAARREARPCAIGRSARLPEAAGAPLHAYLKGPGLRARTLRRIEKEGAVVLDVYDQPSSIQANLPILFDQHIRRWANTGTPSRFNAPGSQAMHLQLAASADARAVLTVLRLNAAPVASLFGFLYQSRLIVYTVAYDPDYKRFHCGLVCIAKTMQAANQRGIRSVDFTRGNEPYKLYFADQAELSHEFILPSSLKGRLLLGTFLAAKDFVLAHGRVRSALRPFGLMASGVERQALEQLCVEPLND